MDILDGERQMANSTSEFPHSLTRSESGQKKREKHVMIESGTEGKLVLLLHSVLQGT